MTDSIQSSVAAIVAAAEIDRADLILVQPPFASPDRPSLGLHILHGIASARGLRVSVVYANLSFASLIGPRLYRQLCHMPTGDLVGERIFRTAWPETAHHGPGTVPDSWADLPDDAPAFEEVQLQARDWAQEMGRALARSPAAVIGFSTVFEQTLACLSIVAAVKVSAPDKVVLLGGANADDEMGEGLADIAPQVDHIFQGEAESSFARFLDDYAADRDIPRLIAGMVNGALDDIPAPDYDTFFAQWDITVGDPTRSDALRRDELWLPYESSRGCWWGAKHHCTFCGLNANGMTHRIKNADKVAREISALSRRHDLEKVLMVDNIMPHSYFSTLLPKLSETEDKLHVFYEQKANLGRTRMAALAGAGIKDIQPGIESLSTQTLKLMRKGSSLSVNLDCLRQARSAGISAAWNLLSDFPGDVAEEYARMAEIVPLLHHLEPPDGLGGLSIDRFSPYHMDPAAFGISNVRPMPSYEEVFPGHDDPRLAYHFVGDYVSGLRSAPDVARTLRDALADWSEAWRAGPPLLFLFDLAPGRRLLVDTREISDAEPRMIDDVEADTLLRGTSERSPLVDSLLARGQLVEGDGRYLPIACAPIASSLWATPAYEAAV